MQAVLESGRERKSDDGFIIVCIVYYTTLHYSIYCIYMCRSFARLLASVLLYELMFSFFYNMLIVMCFSIERLILNWTTRFINKKRERAWLKRSKKKPFSFLFSKDKSEKRIDREIAIFGTSFKCYTTHLCVCLRLYMFIWFKCCLRNTAIVNSIERMGKSAHTHTHIHIHKKWCI